MAPEPQSTGSLKVPQVSATTPENDEKTVTSSSPNNLTSYPEEEVTSSSQKEVMSSTPLQMGSSNISDGHTSKISIYNKDGDRDTRVNTQVDDSPALVDSLNTDITKPLLMDDNECETKDMQQDSDGITDLLVPETVPDVSDIDFFEEPTPPLPPDGGYGWVIVACSFMMNLLVDGMCYMGGMLYIELLDYFQQPKGKTQWVHTLVPAVYLMTGPFVGALVNKFGCRPITIIGSLIGSVFFVISAFAPRVEMLIGTYGVMIGIGFGMIYLPAVCFVSYYFDRRRAIATGIAVCGSGIGTFMFPPLMNFLLSKYGWRGSLLIMSGLCLNCCVFGAMLRPLEASKPKGYKKIHKDQKQTKKELKKEKKMQKEMALKKSIIMQKIIEQKKRQRCISSGSLDGTVITTNNKLVKDPDLLKLILQSETEYRMSNNSPKINNSVPDLSQIHKKKKVLDTYCPYGSSSMQGSCADISVKLDSTSLAPVNKRLEMIKAIDHGSNGRLRKSSVGTVSHNSTHQLSPATSQEHIEKKRKDMSRIMYRQDIFYTGSVTSIAEFKSNPDINQYTQSVVSIPGASGDLSKNKCAPFSNILYQMFDLSLFKSVTFIVLISNAFFSFLGFFVPFMFVPDLAKIQGASGSEAAILISILGACNTFGRLAAGWLADRPWADSLMIQNVALITGGIATALVPLYVNYVLLAAYCCVFGCCMAMFIALRSIVTAEIMGVQKLNNAFGLTIFFQGLAGTAGSPLAGTIFDATGSYTVSFVIAGSFIIFSGVICLPLRRIAKWENSRGSDILEIDINPNEYQTVATEELPFPDYEAEEANREVTFVENQNKEAESLKSKLSVV